MPKTYNNFISSYLWVLDESIITNIDSQNEIKMFLNTANDIDDAVILCGNHCVINIMSVNTDDSVASKY